MIRIKLVVLFAGLALAFHGFQEYQLASRATATPAKLDVAQAESGTRSPNPHVLLGEHVRLYADAIYHYRKKKNDTGGPKPETRVDKVYYPVISLSHPYFKEVQDILDKNGGQIPAGTKRPQISSFAVIIKSHAFHNIGQIPSRMEKSAELTGLAVNLVESLPDGDKKLLRESFPGVDCDKLIIVEEGRKPGSTIGSIAMALIGVGLGFLGLLWLVKGG